MGDENTLQDILRPPPGHWVGDGFPVRTLFNYQDHGAALSPFLLLDYAGPAEFSPTSGRRGVGEHPHRGFETVTIVYQGEVEHRDSAGGGGRIGPGDVQWMTAGSGVVHEELHGRDFASRGGAFEMVQLWVNLPARDKMTAPRYQAIRAAEIPVVGLPGGGTLRVIAGVADGVAGPAMTHSPVEVWDIRLLRGAPADLAVPPGHMAAVVVLDGTMEVNGTGPVRAAEVAVLGRDGGGVRLEAAGEAHVLLLAGQPLDEPVVGMGPFVMNTRDEIRQAVEDYQSGRMGHL